MHNYRLKCGSGAKFIPEIRYQEPTAAYYLPFPAFKCGTKYLHIEFYLSNNQHKHICTTTIRLHNRQRDLSLNWRQDPYSDLQSCVENYTKWTQYCRYSICAIHA